MEVALYHPQYGYYRHGKGPFGMHGDYYTAEQLQPVFGILIAAHIRTLFDALGRPPEFTVVELGAGRGEMATAFAEFHYLPVEIGRGNWPERFTGVVFSNEFFDALPVHVARWRHGRFLEMRVAWKDDKFQWVEGQPVEGDLEDYLRRYAPSPEDGDLVEANLEACQWIEEAARRLQHGYVFTIDYGYLTSEADRFRHGTLMSYQRHTASEDILTCPGERDITAHVCFSALMDHGSRYGLETVRFEPLSRTLIAAGEPDRFTAALTGETPAECLRRSLQLKTLLYGMGEIFRTLLQKKVDQK